MQSIDITKIGNVYLQYSTLSLRQNQFIHLEQNTLLVS